MSADATLARVASRQHGLLTRAQLTEVGFDHRVVARRVARGQWVKLHGNVLRIAGTPVTWESQVLAQVLAAGPDAVASHRSRGSLGPRGHRARRTGAHRALRPAQLPLEGGPGPLQPRPRPGPGCSTRWHRLHRNRPHIARPRRSTTRTRRAARDRQRPTPSVDRLGQSPRHPRGPCAPGPRRCRSPAGILDRHFDETAVSDSAFERLVLTLLFQAGVARPELQHEVIVDDRRYRLDLAYPASKVAIELDGSIHLERHVWEADHARQNALMLLGWTVLRFTWRRIGSSARFETPSTARNVHTNRPDSARTREHFGPRGRRCRGARCPPRRRWSGSAPRAW